MFIRTLDSAIMYNKNFKAFNFIKNKRKGNIIRQFKIKHNREIEFFNEILIGKMIPKRQKNLLQNKDIKLLIVGNNEILYQDISEPCKFLTYNENDDIITIEFDEIIPEETEIICYNNLIDDYYITTVSEALLIQCNNILNELNELYIEYLNSLSNYILYAKNGIILNNILIC